MWAYLNGRFVPQDEARVSVLDRGFLYGDGLFETVLCWNRRLFLWNRHWRRLQRGASTLRLTPPLGEAELGHAAEQLAVKNGLDCGLARLTFSRGEGDRGYTPREVGLVTVSVTTHPIDRPDPTRPVTWQLRTASVRVTRADPLLPIKSANKLRQVLARIDAREQGADEALFLNEHGRVAEAGSGNLFLVRKNQLVTPPVSEGLLPGVTRSVLLDLAARLDLVALEAPVEPQDLPEAESVFLSMTGRGVVEITAIDGQPLARSSRIAELHAAYWRRVAEECER